MTLSDKMQFEQEHANDWVVIAAYGAWEGTILGDRVTGVDGMVLVIATLGGKHGDATQRKYLVDAEKYNSRYRSRFGYVIEPEDRQVIDEEE